jgi:hypothetical protein
MEVIPVLFNRITLDLLWAGKTLRAVVYFSF